MNGSKKTFLSFKCISRVKINWLHRNVSEFDKFLAKLLSTKSETFKIQKTSILDYSDLPKCSNTDELFPLGTCFNPFFWLTATNNDKNRFRAEKNADFRHWWSRKLHILHCLNLQQWTPNATITFDYSLASNSIVCVFFLSFIKFIPFAKCNCSKCEVYKRNDCLKIECYFVWHLTNFLNFIHRMQRLRFSWCTNIAISILFEPIMAYFVVSTKYALHRMVLYSIVFIKLVQTIFGFCIGCSNHSPIFSRFRALPSSPISRFACKMCRAKLFDYAQ